MHSEIGRGIKSMLVWSGDFWQKFKSNSIKTAILAIGGRTIQYPYVKEDKIKSKKSWFQV